MTESYFPYVVDGRPVDKGGGVSTEEMKEGADRKGRHDEAGGPERLIMHVCGLHPIAG